MDTKTFCREIRTEFPAFQVSDDCLELPYLTMGDFAEFAQLAIDTGDKELVKRVFRFAQHAYVDGDGQISNAVGVAFLEHLKFQDGKVRREWAYELLGAQLERPARNLGILPGCRPLAWHRLGCVSRRSAAGRDSLFGHIRGMIVA